jgi:hypothetical protein
MLVIPSTFHNNNRETTMNKKQSYSLIPVGLGFIAAAYFMLTGSGMEKALGIGLGLLGLILGVVTFIATSPEKTHQERPSVRPVNSKPQRQRQQINWGETFQNLGNNIVEIFIGVLATVVSGGISWILYWEEGIADWWIFFLVILLPIISIWLFRSNKNRVDSTASTSTDEETSESNPTQTDNWILAVLEWYGAGKRINGFLALVAICAITFLLTQNVFVKWDYTFVWALTFLSVGSMVARQLAAINERQTPKGDAKTEEGSPP